MLGGSVGPLHRRVPAILVAAEPYLNQWCSADVEAVSSTVGTINYTPCICPFLDVEYQTVDASLPQSFSESPCDRSLQYEPLVDPRITVAKYIPSSQALGPRAYWIAGVGDGEHRPSRGHTYQWVLLWRVTAALVMVLQGDHSYCCCDDGVLIPPYPNPY